MGGIKIAKEESIDEVCKRIIVIRAKRFSKTVMTLLPDQTWRSYKEGTVSLEKINQVTKPEFFLGLRAEPEPECNLGNHDSIKHMAGKTALSTKYMGMLYLKDAVNILLQSDMVQDVYRVFEASNPEQFL